jgi:hypothetical protein
MLPSNTSDFELKNPQVKKSGGPSAGLFFTLALLVLLIGVIAFAVTRLPTGTLSRPAPAAAKATAATVASAVTADAATQAAIQDVIRRLDEAQAQAIATNDPNVMAPTATADFYQQQIAINQDLVNSGVTEVKLLNLEWGQISVADNTATATVYETWSTTFDDGSTEQARDRNVYTLVQENGAWKVQADEHPDQQAAAAPGQAPAP